MHLLNIQFVLFLNWLFQRQTRWWQWIKLIKMTSKMMTMIKMTKWWWWYYQLSCELENDFLYSFFFFFLYFILSSLSLHSYHDPFIHSFISSFIRFDDDIIPFIHSFIFILLNIKIFIHKKMMMKSFIFHLTH